MLQATLYLIVSRSGPGWFGGCARVTLETAMLTTAITAAVTAVLTWLGVPPGPYIAGVWIAVKVLLVAAIAVLGWRAARRGRPAPPADPA